MADVKETLDEIQRRLDEERREEAGLEKAIEQEERRVETPASKPDHARDGGVI